MALFWKLCDIVALSILLPVTYPTQVMRDGITIQPIAADMGIKITENAGSSSISFIITSITELTATGRILERGIHSLESLSDLSRDVSAVRSSLVPYSNNITSSHFTITTQLPESSSTIRMALYVPDEPGSVTLGEHIHGIERNDVLVTVHLQSWDWCGCTINRKRFRGEWLEVTVGLLLDPGVGETTGDPDQNTGTPTQTNHFSLGDNANATFSTQVKVLSYVAITSTAALESLLCILHVYHR